MSSFEQAKKLCEHPSLTETQRKQLGEQLRQLESMANQEATAGLKIDWARIFEIVTTIIQILSGIVTPPQPAPTPAQMKPGAPGQKK